jgi:hypothetical protein
MRSSTNSSNSSSSSSSTPIAVTVGLVSCDSPLDRHLGAEGGSGSSGYCSTDGRSLCSATATTAAAGSGGGAARSREHGPPYSAGDTVGCGVDFPSQQVCAVLQMYCNHNVNECSTAAAAAAAASA